MHTMDMTTALPTSPVTRMGRALAAVAVIALLLILASGLVAAPSAFAAEERERVQLIERPRDALALMLYGTLGLITVAGLATLRRQLKGEREQSDGEFRWR
jgi:NhaP-type Na+/H+ or K+/H+ antiporter